MTGHNDVGDDMSFLRSRKCIKVIFQTGLALVLFVGILNISCLKISASANELDNWQLEIFDEVGDYSYNVSILEKNAPLENQYYVVLPYSAKENQIRICFEGLESILVNNVCVHNGMNVNTLLEERNVVCVLGKKYFLHVLYGSDIPMVYITTESGSMENVYADRNYKEPGNAIIIDNNSVVCEGELEHIKGRGNSSWRLDKKSFNIKFKEKKNLFEMGKSRKWVLLANRSDDTSLRNKIGYEFAETVGFPYVTESRFVDLYVDGEYLGHYLLCEKVEIDEQRIDITDLEKLNEIAYTDIDFTSVELMGEREKESSSIYGSYKWAELLYEPEILSGGYLLEMELESRYYKSVSGFVSSYGQPITVKSPEYASKQQVEYIRNYYQEFENAVISGDGYNELHKHYSEYIDVASFAKMYLMQEFSKNLDGGGASLFFYKDVNGKLIASPVWDLDLAFCGNYEREGIYMNDPEGLWIAVGHLAGEGWEDKYSVFSLLFRHNDFRKEIQKQWEGFFEPNVSEIISNIKRQVFENKESIIADRIRWSSEDSCENAYNEWLLKVKVLEDFIEKRSKYISDVFSDMNCFLEYNSNGGNGSMYDLNYYSSGTKMRLDANRYVHSDREFLGWNTKASGWGIQYADGAEIVLEEDTTLYAQWSKATFKDKVNAFLLGITGN